MNALERAFNRKSTNREDDTTVKPEPTNALDKILNDWIGKSNSAGLQGQAYTWSEDHKQELLGFFDTLIAKAKTEKKNQFEALTKLIHEL